MTKKKYMIWVLPAAVAIMIFYFSMQPAEESSALSNELILKMLHFLSGINGNIDSRVWLERLSTPVRKAAHVSEYFLFFLTLLAAWYVSGVRRGRLAADSMPVVFLYACTDEFHQIFVDGRAGCFSDVLIDCSGAALLSFLLLFYWHFKGSTKGKTRGQDTRE